MDFKKNWQNMAEIDPPVGILTFFKQALVSIKKLEKLFAVHKFDQRNQRFRVSLDIAPKARLRLHETV